jgi:transposase
MDAIAEHLGYFRLLTNTGMTPAEALRVYRRKDVIEKGFDDLKNNVDMRRMETRDDDPTEGEMFGAFLALIEVSQMEVKLGEAMRKNYGARSK